MPAKFGPAGNPDNFPYSSSLEAPKWLADMGLDCYEYQCGRGVNLSPETARKLGAAAQEAGITLSLHAPYFINLANPDPTRQKQTVGYILSSCAAALWMGAGRVILHTGALLKRSRREAMQTATAFLREILILWEEKGFSSVALCLETMGKINQLGDLPEVLELCQLDPRLVPCVDFGHLYARSMGRLTGPAACEEMLRNIETALGETRASQFHAHFSKIEFTPNGGEKRHRTFDDSGGFGPDPEPLMKAVARRGWTPTFICESAGTQTTDALTLKSMYETSRKGCLLP